MSKNKLNNKKSRDLSSRYVVKSKIMEKGLHKKYSEISQVLFFDSYGLSNTDLTFLKYTPSEARKLNNLYARLYPNVWKECSRINNASYKRASRLRDKIISMLWSSDCVFITFTFTDKVFEKTSEDTRRRYVRRFLKDLNSKYVANIDYGSLNGREHYHGVIQLPYIPIEKLKWWYEKYRKY